MNTEPMQPADFLPFVNRNIASLQHELVMAADRILKNPLRGLSRQEREERLPKTLAFLWHGRALIGFYAGHYPDGAVFDYHGVEAMVEGTLVIDESYTRRRVVKACVKAVGGGLERMTIPESLAMALVWRKYNLPEQTV